MAGLVGTGAGAPIVKLYHEKSMILPDVSRVLACLYEKDIQFERETASYTNILKLQASTRAPVPFYDGDKFLQDSREICRYIAETYEHRGYRYLLGKDVLERATIEQWLRNEEHAFDPPSRALFCHLAFPLPFDNGADIDAEKRKLEEVLEVYEQRLSESEYLAGNKFTLADLVHLPNSHHIVTSRDHEFAYLYDSRKNVQRWWNAISNRDSWKKVVRDMEELEHQQQQPWHSEVPPVRDVRIDHRKQEGTKAKTVLVPPPAAATSVSFPAAPQEDKLLPTETTIDLTPPTTQEPPSQRTRPATSRKPPDTDQNTKSGFFAPPQEGPEPRSQAARPTTPRKPSTSDQKTQSAFFTPATSPTIDKSRTKDAPPAIQKTMASQEADEGTPYAGPAPQEASDEFPETDETMDAVAPAEATDVEPTPQTPAETPYARPPTKDTPTEARPDLQAGRWHAVAAELSHLKEGTDQSVPDQRWKYGEDAKLYPEQDEEQAGTRWAAQKLDGRSGQPVRGPATPYEQERTEQAKRAPSDQVAAAPRSKQAVGEDRGATTPSKTRYSDAPEGTKRAGESAPETRRTADRDDQATFEETKIVDSTPSKAQPWDSSRPAPPSPKQVAAEDTRGRHAEDITKQTRDGASKLIRKVTQDDQDIFEETKPADSTSSKAQPWDSRRPAAPSPKQVAAEDARGRRAEHITKQTRDSASKLIQKATQDDQDIFEETKPADSTSSKAQPWDSRRLGFPSPKQVAPEDVRDRHAEDISKQAGDIVSKPMRQAAQDDQHIFEQAKPADSTTSKAQYLDSRRLGAPSPKQVAPEEAHSRRAEDFTKQAGDTTSTPMATRYDQDISKETKPADSTPSKTQPWDSRRLGSPSPKQVASEDARGRNAEDIAKQVKPMRKVTQDDQDIFEEKRLADSAPSKAQPWDSRRLGTPSPKQVAAEDVRDRHAEDITKQVGDTASKPIWKATQDGQDIFEETKPADSTPSKTKPWDSRRVGYPSSKQVAEEDARGRHAEDITKQTRDSASRPMRKMTQGDQDIFEETKPDDTTSSKAQPWDSRRLGFPSPKQVAAEDVRDRHAEDISKQVGDIVSKPMQKATQDDQYTFEEARPVDSTKARRPSAPSPKQVAPEDARSRRAAEDFTKQAGDTTSTPMAAQYDQDIFEETRLTDSAPSKAQPWDSKRPGTPSPKREAAEDVHSRHAEDITKQVRDTASRPMRKVTQEGPDIFEETKPTDSTPSKTQPWDSRRLGYPSSKQVAAEDARGRRAEDITKQTRDSASRPMRKVTQGDQDIFEETKPDDTTSSKAQPWDSRKLGSPLPKQVAAQDVRDHHPEDISKQAGDIASKPMEKASQDDQYNFEEEEPADSVPRQVESKDGRSRRAQEFTKVSRGAQDTFEETKTTDFASSRAKPWDSRRPATPPKQVVADDARGRHAEDITKQTKDIASTPMQRVARDTRDTFEETKTNDAAPSRDAAAPYVRPAQREISDKFAKTDETNGDVAHSGAHEAHISPPTHRGIDTSSSKLPSSTEVRPALQAEKWHEVEAELSRQKGESDQSVPDRQLKYVKGANLYQKQDKEEARTRQADQEPIGKGGQPVQGPTSPYMQQRPEQATRASADQVAAAPSPKHVDGDDFRSAMTPSETRYRDAQDATKQARKSAAAQTAARDVQATFEETKAADSASSTAQPPDARRPTGPPKQVAAEEDRTRGPHAEDITKQARDTTSMPMQKEARDAQVTFEERKAISSPPARQAVTQDARGTTEGVRKFSIDKERLPLRPSQVQPRDIEEASKQSGDTTSASRKMDVFDGGTRDTTEGARRPTEERKLPSTPPQAQSPDVEDTSKQARRVVARDTTVTFGETKSSDFVSPAAPALDAQDGRTTEKAATRPTTDKKGAAPPTGQKAPSSSPIQAEAKEDAKGTTSEDDRFSTERLRRMVKEADREAAISRGQPTDSRGPVDAEKPSDAQDVREKVVRTVSDDEKAYGSEPTPVRGTADDKRATSASARGATFDDRRIAEPQKKLSTDGMDKLDEASTMDQRAPMQEPATDARGSGEDESAKATTRGTSDEQARAFAGDQRAASAAPTQAPPSDAQHASTPSQEAARQAQTPDARHDLTAMEEAARAARGAGDDESAKTSTAAQGPAPQAPTPEARLISTPIQDDARGVSDEQARASTSDQRAAGTAPTQAPSSGAQRPWTPSQEEPRQEQTLDGRRDLTPTVEAVPGARDDESARMSAVVQGATSPAPQQAPAPSDDDTGKILTGDQSKTPSRPTQASVSDYQGESEAIQQVAPGDELGRASDVVQKDVAGDKSREEAATQQRVGTPVQLEEQTPNARRGAASGSAESIQSPPVVDPRNGKTSTPVTGEQPAGQTREEPSWSSSQEDMKETSTDGTSTQQLPTEPSKAESVETIKKQDSAIVTPPVSETGQSRGGDLLGNTNEKNARQAQAKASDAPDVQGTPLAGTDSVQSPQQSLFDTPSNRRTTGAMSKEPALPNIEKKLEETSTDEKSKAQLQPDQSKSQSTEDIDKQTGETRSSRNLVTPKQTLSSESNVQSPQDDMKQGDVTDEASRGRSQVEASDQQLSNSQANRKAEWSMEASEEPKQRRQTDKSVVLSPQDNKQGGETAAAVPGTNQKKERSQSQEEASDMSGEQNSSGIQQPSKNRNNSKSEPDDIEGNRL